MKASTSWCGSLRTNPTVSVSEHRLAAGQLEATGDGIEGGEEPVLGQDAGIGERVEERGLAGVGVADDGDAGVGALASAFGLVLTHRRHGGELGLELVHPADQAPPIDLELGLAGSTGADAAALLTQSPPRPTQTRQPVPQLCELDLGAPFGRRGVLGEDVEDHRGAIEGAASEDALEVELLGGAELVVEDDRVGIERNGQVADLVGLALPDEGRGVGPVTALGDPGDDVGAGGVDELGQLVERLVDGLVIGVVTDDTDDDDSFPEGAVDEPSGLAAELAEPAAVGVGITVIGVIGDIWRSGSFHGTQISRCRRIGVELRHDRLPRRPPGPPREDCDLRRRRGCPRCVLRGRSA